MAFRKVTHASGPKHQFFVAEETLARFPDKYKAVDEEKYPAPGRVEFIEPATQSKPAPRKTAAKKTAARKPAAAATPESPEPTEA